MTKFNEKELTEETETIKLLYDEDIKNESVYLSGTELFEATVIELKKIIAGLN